VNPDLRDAWFDLALSYTYAREWKFSEYCIARVKKMGGDTNFLEAELKKARPPEKPQPKQEKSKGLEPGNVFGIIVPRKPPTESQQAVAVQYQTGGGRYLETKQYALAVDQYKQALAINPGLTDCWSDFALALTYSGQYDLAQAAIDELKKLGGDATFATAELAKAKPQGPGVSANGNVAPPGMK
ncbi:MAG: hypothetical protein HY303_10525, partial [Candidatus Wallbacteria bacterium]|nr:hypothetical protein [Candidatus Wallbacteria bacterium]